MTHEPINCEILQFNGPLNCLSNSCMFKTKIEKKTSNNSQIPATNNNYSTHDSLNDCRAVNSWEGQNKTQPAVVVNRKG